MRIVYIAFDGTEFDSEFACRDYERSKMNSFRMWDRKGNETNDPDNALFVLLKEEDAGKAFIGLCNDSGSPCTGICEGDVGFYYWNDWNDEYLYLEAPVLDAIEKILHQLR